MAGTFLTDDLADAYDTDELATAGTVSGTEVPGFFDHDYARGVQMVSGATTAFRVPASYSAAAVGSTITIGTSSYTIRDRQPMDDDLEVVLELEAQ